MKIDQSSDGYTDVLIINDQGHASTDDVSVDADMDASLDVIVLSSSSDVQVDASYLDDASVIQLDQFDDMLDMPEEDEMDEGSFDIMDMS